MDESSDSHPPTGQKEKVGLLAPTAIVIGYSVSQEQEPPTLAASRQEERCPGLSLSPSTFPPVPRTA